MIVTVTLNPAIDKTIEIDRFVYQGLNRVCSVQYDVGGKGINVSKTICELGGESVAIGFLGGQTGQVIDGALRKQGIISDFVWVSGETRTNTKIVETDGTLTELNEPGTGVCEEDVQRLKEKLIAYADENTVFVFAGSIPHGMTADIYRKCICLVKERGAYVILDASGETFRLALEANPNVIKPNREELEMFLGETRACDVQRLIEEAGNIQKKGIGNVVVSMGKEGALFLMGKDVFVCDGLQVPVSSSVGAGDAMVAALAYAWEYDLNKEETIKLCMATSAGAVTTRGTKPPAKELVEELMKQVEIKSMYSSCE